MLTTPLLMLARRLTIHLMLPGRDIANLGAIIVASIFLIFFRKFSSNMSTAESDDNKTDLAAEVLWCIQHLEGLLDKGKLSEKKMKEARTCYKLLKNPDTPLPRLRQAMRNSCGDYKAKMMAEGKEVKLISDKISQCDVSKAQSNFIKKSVTKPVCDKKREKVEFKFNFNIDTTD